MIDCEFDYSNIANEYCCTIRLENNFPCDVNEKSFKGNHQIGYNNGLVRGLYLFGCRFELGCFPKGLCNVFNYIRCLVIFNSNLNTISKEDLKEARALRKIWLRNNEIKFIPSNLLYYTKNLNKVKLENNQIQNIPADLFNYSSNLVEIDLGRNQIKKIDPNLFNNLPVLKDLDLRYNELEYIPGDLFEFNPRLERINFEGNKIKFIGPALLDRLSDLNQVKMACVNFRANSAIDVKMCNCYDVTSDKSLKSFSEVKNAVKSLRMTPKVRKALELSNIKIQPEDWTDHTLQFENLLNEDQGLPLEPQKFFYLSMSL